MDAMSDSPRRPPRCCVMSTRCPRSGNRPWPNSGTLGLCGFSTAAGLLLPPTMCALNAKFPHLHTQTIEAEPSECFDLLLSGDADVGIIVAAPDIPAGGDERFSQHFLIDDPL